MTEEVLDMGKPKKTRAKAITRAELDDMFAKRDEEITKKLDEMCDNCSHHECECPKRLDNLEEVSEARMDQLDENDELLRENINKLADQTGDAFNRMHKEVEQNTKGLEFAAKTMSEVSQYAEDLSARLEEEHRLRVESEERIAELSDDNAALKGQVEDMRKENTVFANQNLKLGILAGACLGLCLCVLAFFMVR